MRGDLGAVTAGQYAAELIATSLVEADPHPEMFEVLCKFLGHIGAGKANLASLVRLMWLVLHYTGHLPQWERCGACGQGVGAGEAAYFGLNTGGLICTECSGRVGQRVRVEGPLSAALQAGRPERAAGRGFAAGCVCGTPGGEAVAVQRDGAVGDDAGERQARRRGEGERGGGSGNRQRDEGGGRSEGGGTTARQRQRIPSLTLRARLRQRRNGVPPTLRFAALFLLVPGGTAARGVGALALYPARLYNPYPLAGVILGSQRGRTEMAKTFLYRVICCGLLCAVALCGTVLAAPKPPLYPERQVYNPVTGTWSVTPTPIPGTEQGDLQLGDDRPGGKPSEAGEGSAEEVVEEVPGQRVRGEGMVALGDAELALNNRMQAYKQYEKALDQYPGLEGEERIVRSEFAIGVAFLAGVKQKVFGIFRFPAYEEGLDILEKVVQRTPGAALAEDAIKAKADYYYRNGEFALAETEYARLAQSFRAGGIRGWPC